MNIDEKTQAERPPMPPAPVVPIPKADRLPAEMLKCESWITWRAEWAWHETKQKWKLNKVPCVPETGNNCSFNGNHSTFREATTRVSQLRKEKGTHFGIGVAFSGVDGFFCLDFDDELDGGISDRLTWIAQNYPTWAETSISGNGLHLFYRGTATGKEVLSWRGRKIEVFGSTGFIAITGNCTEPASPPMGDGTELLSLIHSERDADEKPKAKSAERNGEYVPRTDGELSPGDDFDVRGSWREVLEPHGWSLAKGSWESGEATRPEKSGGTSASIGTDGRRGSKGEPLLSVYTTEAFPFLPETTYGKFRAYALLNHRGNNSDAARELGSKGYGTRSDGFSQRVTVTSNGSTKQAEPSGEPEKVGWQWDLISSKELIEGDFRPTWLVKRLIVAKQPLIVGGPEKTLKTNTSIDLAVSLSSGTPFLNHFNVYRKVRVAILSGESGAHTIQETFRRICKDRNIDPAECDIQWGFTLPSLANVHDLDNLERGIQEAGIGFIIVDPAYLAMLKGIDADNAKNFFAMGELLAAFSERCIRAGCTPCIVHHANKQLQPGEMMELIHLSYSGFSQFARQWLLYSRLSEYEGDGKHVLHLNAGGSCGQGGRFAVSIDEGILQEDFTGRVWGVMVEPVGVHRDKAKKAKEADKELKTKKKEEANVEKARTELRKNCETIFQMLKAGPKTVTQMRDARGWKPEKINHVIETLLCTGDIEPTSIMRPRGKGEAETLAYQVTEGIPVNQSLPVQNQELALVCTGITEIGFIPVPASLPL